MSKEWKAPDKVTQKMTRDGAVAENLTTGETSSISERPQEENYSAPAGAAAEMGMGPSHRVSGSQGRPALSTAPPGPSAGDCGTRSPGSAGASPASAADRPSPPWDGRGSPAQSGRSAPAAGKTLRHRLSSLNSNNYYYLYIISCWKMQALFQNSDNIRLSGAGGNFRC